MNKYFISLIVLSLFIVGCSTKQASTPNIVSGDNAPVINDGPNNNPSTNVANNSSPNTPSEPINMDNKTVKLNSSGPSASIEYTPVVSFVNTPTVSNGKISVSWQISGSNPDLTVSSRIYFDSVPHPGTFGREDFPDTVGYNDWTELFVSDNEKYVPRSFSTTIDIPANATVVYLRAYAIVTGYNYWSNEVAVNVQ